MTTGGRQPSGGASGSLGWTKVLEQELPLPSGMVLESQEEKRSPTCLHFHVSSKDITLARAFQKAASQDPPQDVLPASGPAGGWSEAGLCS